MKNEAQTRLDLIDPALKAAGWGVVDGSYIRVEVVALGRLQGAGERAAQEKADYVLVYKNQKLAVVEAKREDFSVTEGLRQAKKYAEKLQTPFAYSTNGHGIYRVDMRTGDEGNADRYPTPDELWDAVYAESKAQEKIWRNLFSAVPFEDKGGQWQARYYQHNAITKTLDAIAGGQDRILLTMATGTGKTAIAFQIAWKLFHSNWNISDWRNGLKEGQSPKRMPRILFLADRNILADQAFNEFSKFPDDALVRINPQNIRKRGRVPTNGSVFFTIFQTFMSGRDADGNSQPSFDDYQPDFFDFIIIDECHRGGANDEGNWRAIMQYFAPAVQLGLTATPKRDNNADTYTYFGKPVYIYSLKEGINDGYLTPFKVRQIATTIDEYLYTPDDDVVAGEIDEVKRYIESDFNRNIVIKERERARVKIFMDAIDQHEKTLVFCATQSHALLVRDIINQMKTSSEANYCVRVTANDGEDGEQYLHMFQDNEQSTPTILTTSRKLSTGVDARNVRNIVLMRPVNSMIEFKQIIGRGTRLFEGKDYFTVYDFVKAYEHFNDSAWDGEPVDAETCAVCGANPCECGRSEPDICPVCGKQFCTCVQELPQPCRICGETPCTCKRQEMITVKLADGKERNIQHMTATTFWGEEGGLLSAQQFIKQIFRDLPEFFDSDDQLRKIWSKPATRRKLLDDLREKGYGQAQLAELQKLINAEDSDIYDVLAYIAFDLPVISRQRRVDMHKDRIIPSHGYSQREFLEFVLKQYIRQGVSELDEAKLPELIKLKYHTVEDGIKELGDVDEIKKMFIGFQSQLYERSFG